MPAFARIDEKHVQKWAQAVRLRHLDPLRKPWDGIVERARKQALRFSRDQALRFSRDQALKGEATTAERFLQLRYNLSDVGVDRD